MNGVALCGDDGRIRDSFAVGESVFVSAAGLPAYATITFSLQDRPDGKPVPVARYTGDRHGSLPLSPLIVHLGLQGPGDPAAIWTHDEAEKRLAGRRFGVRAEIVADGHRDQQRLTFVVLGDDRAPRLFSSDAKGRIVTGVESHTDADVGVMLRNFPPGCVRVTAVARQFGWRPGDPVEPVRTRTGRPVAVTARLDGATSFVRLAHVSELRPGSYQFIARSYSPGWYEADEPILLRGDTVSDLRFASLVIRNLIRDSFGFENGVVLTPRIAGRPLAHRPYFHFLNNFPTGTDVYAALDPDALPPGLVSQRAAIYVIRHKSAADWNASSALTDVSGPGMTSSVKIVPIVPGCVNWNTTLVWPNPQTPGMYDIVIDFGNNAADPSQFVPSGQLKPPLDMIDGYVRVGFYVTQDPSLPGPYAGTIGQHDYALPAIDVPSPDGINPTDSLPITATIRYPAQSSGPDALFANGAFPLVVIMHGNSGMDTSYLGYNYLLDHLASWGFVAMSIYAPVGVMIETRARAILAHLNEMAQLNAGPGLFQGHVDFGNVGIAGHSRGGEAVVRAAQINTAEGQGWNIRGGASIAPTDYHHYGPPGIPLLVIYGANDGDVSGGWPDRTGFNIYDEAGRPRSHVFVYGATHDRFNTEWASIEAMTELTWDIAPSDIPNLISLVDHENVAKGYITAFFQACLQGAPQQLAYFSDGLKPSLVADIGIHVSHQPPGPTVVDAFVQNDPTHNALGGGVTGTGLATMAENQLRTLDGHSPHVVAGGNVAWTAGGGIYQTAIPAAGMDVSGAAILSFRVSQKYESVDNPVGQPLDFHVTLSDASGNSRAIRVSTFTDVPYPYVRGYDTLVKSALKSVRIPLASYKIANAGAQDVDLTKVSSISFTFDTQNTGEIDIDDIEFGN